MSLLMRDTNWWRIIFTSLPNYRHVEVELDRSGRLDFLTRVGPTKSVVT